MESKASDLPSERFLSTTVMLRITLLLLALWNVFAGLSLTFFQGLASASIGGGINDDSAQRLLGAHILLLVPAYLILARSPLRYRAFLWLPYAGQMAIAAATLYDLVTRRRDVSDGTLPLVTSLIFLLLLLAILIWGQRTGEVPIEQLAAVTGEPQSPAPGEAPESEEESQMTGSPTDEDRTAKEH